LCALVVRGHVARKSGIVIRELMSRAGDFAVKSVISCWTFRVDALNLMVFSGDLNGGSLSVMSEMEIL
jgi:hypothetical protein